MAVKIRLTRLGDKKSPFYRIVVADARVSRDKKYIDLIGTYNPLTSPEEVKIDEAKAVTWLKNGAQPTETVKALLKKSGIELSKKKKDKKEKPAAKKPAKAEAKPAAKKTATKTTTAKKSTEAKAE